MAERETYTGRRQSRSAQPYFEDFGRALDLEWFRKFNNTFNQLTEDLGIEFEPVVSPGIVYTLGRILKSNAREGGVIHGATRTPEVIDLLVDKRIVDEDTARSDLTLRAKDIIFNYRSDKNIVKVQVKTSDKDTNLYKGHVVQGEKDAVRDFLGEEKDAVVGRIPRQVIALGTVVCNPALISDDIRSALRISINPNVGLGSLGTDVANYVIPR